MTDLRGGAAEPASAGPITGPPVPGRPPGVSSPRYQIRIHHADADLHALLPEWRELFDRCPTASVFMAPGWMATWWDVIGSRIPGRRLAVISARNDDGDLVGLLPLFLRPAWRGPAPVRILGLLGTGEMSPEHLDVITDAVDRPGIARALVGGLDQLESWFDLLDLTDLAEHAVLLPATAEWARARRHPLRLREGEHCPYVPIVGSYEAYLQSLASAHRYKVRSFGRRLAAAHRVELEVVTAPGRIGEALDVVFRLHRLRWRDKGRPSSFDRRSMRRFHARAAEALAADGHVAISLLCSDGEPVAACYCLQAHGRVAFYQPGFDPAYSRFHVGKVLLGRVLERCFADGDIEFDFLRGLEPYKFDWTRTVRPTRSIEVATSNHGTWWLAGRIGRRQAAAAMHRASGPVLEHLRTAKARAGV